MVQSYYDSILIKSDATSETIYDIIKLYKKSITKDGEDIFKNLKENTYKYNILANPINPNLKPVFIESELNKSRPARYFPHPIKNWGPKGKPKELLLKYALKFIK